MYVAGYVGQASVCAACGIGGASAGISGVAAIAARLDKQTDEGRRCECDPCVGDTNSVIEELPHLGGGGIAA